MARTRAGRLFSRLTPSTEQTLSDVLRTERAGGILLLIGTVVALVWANSAWADVYETMQDHRGGPARAPPGPRAGNLGQGRSAGHLLLCDRP